MELTTTTHGATSIITVNADRIDASVAIQFKDAMRAATDGGPDHVVLDLGQVKFIDSSGSWGDRRLHETDGQGSSA